MRPHPQGVPVRRRGADQDLDGAVGSVLGRVVAVAAEGGEPGRHQPYGVVDVGQEGAVDLHSEPLAGGVGQAEPTGPDGPGDAAGSPAETGGGEQGPPWAG
ncbi:hypothetical protein [Peterkaempfera sp. SMS 1(5)a]|uniref:hypothetical protein n=1 Tax=Peterkaempfera podocarpi TaxID=3232308 RepID=UPI00366B0AD9